MSEPRTSRSVPKTEIKHKIYFPKMCGCDERRSLWNGSAAEKISAKSWEAGKTPGEHFCNIFLQISRWPRLAQSISNTMSYGKGVKHGLRWGLNRH